MLPTEMACGVAVGVSVSVSAPLSASVYTSVSCSVSEVSRSDPRPCSDAAVRNVSMELDREAACVWPLGADGMRKDDGPMSRVVVIVVIDSEPKDGRAGRRLPDVAL